MFDKFTQNAKHAIIVSQDETLALGYDYIGAEHLLLGLLAVPDGLAGQVLTEHGVTPRQARDKVVGLLTEAGVTGTRGQAAVDALASIGIDVDEIRKRMDDTFGPGKFQYPRPPYTAQAKKMLEQTVREAMRLGSDSIDTEHMLLGMLEDADSVAVQVLTALDVDPDAVRSAVLGRVGAADS